MDKINLSSALKLYERYSRENDKEKSLYYIVSKNDFAVMNSEKCADSDDFILMMNCYNTCLEIIDLYLEQPYILQYEAECKERMKDAKSKVVACLWFFDHIDGAYDFELFEDQQIRNKMERWCKKKWYQFFWGPEVKPYDQQTWLSAERTKTTKKTGHL